MSNAAPDVQLLAVAEFCQRYAISVRSFYREVNAGRLRVKKIGRSTRVPVEAAQEWLASAPDYQPQAAA